MSSGSNRGGKGVKAISDDSSSDSDDTSTTSQLADSVSTDFFDSDPSVGEFQPASAHRPESTRPVGRYGEVSDEFCEAKEEASSSDLTESDFQMAKSDTSNAVFDSVISDESDAATADFSQAASDIYSSVASASETERTFLGEESDGQYETPVVELAKPTSATPCAISSSESSVTTESSDLETSFPDAIQRTVELPVVATLGETMKAPPGMRPNEIISAKSSSSTDSSSLSNSDISAKKSVQLLTEKYDRKMQELPVPRSMERVSGSHSDISSPPSQSAEKSVSTTEEQRADERPVEGQEADGVHGYDFGALFRVAALANMFWSSLQQAESTSTVSSSGHLRSREGSLADILFRESATSARQDPGSKTHVPLRASTSDFSVGLSSASHVTPGHETTSINLLPSRMPRKSLSETAASLISSVFAATNVGPLANVHNIDIPSSQSTTYHAGAPIYTPHEPAQDIPDIPDQEPPTDIMPLQSTFAAAETQRTSITNVNTTVLENERTTTQHFLRKASLSSLELSSDILSSTSSAASAATAVISKDLSLNVARQPDPVATVPVQSVKTAHPIRDSPAVVTSSTYTVQSDTLPDEPQAFGQRLPQIAEEQENRSIKEADAQVRTTAAVAEPPSAQKCASQTSRATPRGQSSFVTGSLSSDNLAGVQQTAAHNEVVQDSAAVQLDAGGPSGDGVATQDQHPQTEAEYDYTSMFRAVGLISWLWASPDTNDPSEPDGGPAQMPETDDDRADGNLSQTNLARIDAGIAHNTPPSTSSSGGTFSDISDLPAEEIRPTAPPVERISSSTLSSSSILSTSSDYEAKSQPQQKSTKKLLNWFRNVVTAKAKFRIKKREAAQQDDSESDPSSSTLSSDSSTFEQPYPATAVAPRKGISSSTLTSSTYSRSTTSEVRIEVEPSNDDVSFADALEDPVSEASEPMRYGFLAILRYIGLAALYWGGQSEELPADIESIEKAYMYDQQKLSFASVADSGVARQALSMSVSKPADSRTTFSSSLLSDSSDLASTTTSSSIPVGKMPPKVSDAIADRPAREPTGSEKKEGGGSKSKTFAVTLLSLFACVGGVTLLTITLISGQPSLAELSRRSQKQFSSALQVEEVDDMAADWSSDLGELQSPKAVKIIDALKPKIRSAFEAEGFTTDAVNITKIGPISVAIYDIMNNTVTSLSAVDELSLAPIYKSEDGKTIPEKDMPKPQGHRLVLRVEFETVGKPVDNTPLINQVGEAEAGKIQYMLGKHMENQGAVAMAEAVEVSKEFQNVAKLTVPRHRSTRNIEIAQLDRKIDCQKTGKELAMSRALVTCPADCEKVFKDSNLFGTDWYHINSPICHAAIHSFVLESGEGGEVEFMTLGESFLFTGSVRNGIKSNDLLEYGEKFMVKKPGPSWTTQVPPSTTEMMSTTEGLQEVNRILLIGKMTSISLDNNRIQFSLGLSYSQKYENEVKALLRSKISYALEEMKLKLDRVEVSGFEPDLPSASALRIRFVAYGGYRNNAPAMQAYKPWDWDMIENLGDTLKNHIIEEGLVLHGLAIHLDRNFVDALSNMPPTEEVPTTTSTICSCAEVYFIQSLADIKSEDDAQHIYDMYEQIFQSSNFDQFHLRVGITVLHPSDHVEISSVGELLPHELLSALRHEIQSRIEASDSRDTQETEKLWEALEVLLHTRFFTDNLKDRKKLLVVTTSFVFGPGAATNVDVLQRVKDKGIKVVYSGYSWDQKFLEENNYPEQYASKPVINFSKKVKSLGETAELADFYNAVMRKYICGTSLGICDATKNNTVESKPTVGPEVAGSYLYGLPNGTGLQDYEIRGGITYKGKKLKTTESFRKTEPDDQQAFYMNYECGKQTINPILRSSRIVGGNEAVAHSWPWIVSFNQINTETNPHTREIEYTHNRWVCGGTIIDSIWVVTAAHCFAHGEELKYTTDYQIVTGLHDQKVLKSMKGEVYDIRRIVYHPFYSDAQNKYDIALVQTHKPITFRREVSPACLPNPDVVPRIGKSCIIAGWGYTSNTGKTDRSLLKQAGQIVEDPNRCQKVYRSLSYDPNINMCSKRFKSAVAMQCRGDSGGPLVCFEHSKWVLYGVANYGPAKCEKGGEGVYSLVPTMLEWMCCYIKSKIGPCAYTRCNKSMM